MVSRPRSIFVFVALVAMLSSAIARAATLPAGFSESLVASGLSSPTAMQFAPDGRLFVCEQGGTLRVIKNGSLLATPFLSLNVDSQGERGLLGVAFDPAFASNQYVYVYYTTASSPVHNRISRFIASGDVAASNSEFVILDLENLSTATNHNGGAIDFGADGKLYVAVGDNANSGNAQVVTNRLGKMLRLNPDGTIPSDNPTLGNGVNRAIWALGLRNPFTFAFDSDGIRMFINDVGQNTWEEINNGIREGNYGWPATEGPTDNPGFVSPTYAYTHASGGCAITGGAFYTPGSTQFPSEYISDYFFADFCGNWIKRLDPANGNTITDFATGISSPVDLKVVDGSLYYLARGGGAVYRVIYNSGPSAPSIAAHPTNQSVTVGGSATFSVSANGTTPLTYRWQRNGADIAGAAGAGPSYTLSNATLQDNGATFRVRVTNSTGNAVSNSATLTVTNTPNNPPTAAISQPAANALYSGGSVITYAGTGTDQQDGTLPASAFNWHIDFHHDSHTHPFLQPTTGARSGSVTIPTAGETSANVWYRIYLTVRDAGGLTHTVQRDIVPRKVLMTLNTNPAGLQVRLDGQPTATPLAFEAVVGMTRNLSPQSPQVVGNTTYEFVSWSDGGPATHDVSTPSVDTTYTATYRAVPTGPAPGPGAPPPPTLSSYTNGLSLNLWWTPVPDATSYVLEAGTATNASDLLTADVGRLTSLQEIAPPGTYFARVRSVGPGGTSAPSNEVQLTLGGAAPCVTPPPPPSGYAVQVSGLDAALSWSRSPSATSYTLEAGAEAGSANLFNANVGNVQALSATGPAGVYFTRLRAINACGASDPSSEARIDLGCSGPPPAPTLTIANANGFITLSWTSSAGATLYRAQVGTAPDVADVSADLGAGTSLSVDARGIAGTFFIRVFAIGACGTSTASNEVSVTLP